MESDERRSNEASPQTSLSMSEEESVQEGAFIMTTINRGNQQTAEEKMIGGLQKHEPTLPSIVLAGATYKTADVITVVQGLVNSAQKVTTLRAAWPASIVSHRDARAKQKALMSGLRAAIRAAFGGSLDVLADFGPTPRKTPPVSTPEEKAQAVATAKATRAARHTMGKKQKAAIKGTPVASALDATKGPVASTPPAPPPAPT